MQTENVMKNTRLLAALTTVLLLQLGCKKDPPVVPPIEPPPYQQTVFLSVADSGLTEVYLKLSMTDTLPPREYSILRNNVQILSGSLFGRETTLVDTTAQRNTSYFYQAFRQENAINKDSSNTVTTKTLDTTSHNFIWQLFTLGDGNASVVFDVAIIDENNIWVVGDINYLDSTGLNYVRYSAAHWDGVQWKKIQIRYKTVGGDTLVLAPIRGIVYFSERDIWFAAGSIFHWESNSSLAELVHSRLQNPEPFPFYEKLYGASNRDIYFVGYNGSLLHYDGGTWQRLVSGTTLDIYDVHGDFNNTTKEFEIIAVAAKLFENSEHKVIKIQGTTATQLSDSGLVGPQNGVWFKAGKQYYIVGNGIYQSPHILVKPAWERLSRSITMYYTNDVDGNDLNDVVACGSFGELLHFNGATWKSFRTSIPGNSNNEYERIKQKGNIVVSVGWQSPRGVVAIGKRN